MDTQERSARRRARGGRPLLFSCALVAALALLAARASADWNGLQLVSPVSGGITSMAFAPGDTQHLFVALKRGEIDILDLATGHYLPTPFLTAANIDTEVEGGMLGLAFHPQYQTNGKFYVTVTRDNGGIPIGGGETSPYTAEVREYTASAADPLAADASYKTIIDWVKPQAVHTGGWLGFSPTNPQNLYIMTGDGGGEYDSANGHTPGIGNAQDLYDNRLGKVLRVDVSRDDFPGDDKRNYGIPASNPFAGTPMDPEIFAYGLRSPWKGSFDRATGNFWIADVGENSREEIDLIPAGSYGGQNFGWRLREGSAATPAPGIGGNRPAGNVDPVYDYVHTWMEGSAEFQGNSVTGGFVYRGPDPELQGKYLFADFVSNQFWTFDPRNPYATVTNVTDKLKFSTVSDGGVTTMAEDAVGNLYVGTFSGNVYRVLTNAITAGDFEADADVDSKDLLLWCAGYGTTSGASSRNGDANGDGSVDGADVLLWQRRLGYSALHVASTENLGGVPEAATQSLLLAALLVAGSAIPRRT